MAVASAGQGSSGTADASAVSVAVAKATATAIANAVAKATNSESVFYSAYILRSSFSCPYVSKLCYAAHTSKLSFLLVLMNND